MQSVKPENENPVAAPLDAAQLAEAFALFSRASEELSTAYNALQGQVGQLTERLSVLMGALPAGVLVLDRRGVIVQANRAAASLLGSDLAGRDWHALMAALEPAGTPGELHPRRQRRGAGRPERPERRAPQARAVRSRTRIG